MRTNPIKGGDFGAYGFLREPKADEEAILRLIAEKAYLTEYERSWALARSEGNLSGYFREIAGFCKTQVDASYAAQQLDCCRESHASDIRCLSYTDCLTEDAGEIRESESYRQCRDHLTKNGRAATS